VLVTRLKIVSENQEQNGGTPAPRAATPDPVIRGFRVGLYGRKKW
jgi:hypothetical protein